MILDEYFEQPLDSEVVHSRDPKPREEIKDDKDRIISKRDLKILDLYKKGLVTVEIANQTGYSYQTVYGVGRKYNILHGVD